MRTAYDLEMLAEVGVCSGIENYSRHIEGRSAGEPPNTLLDFFPKDYLLVIDETHQTVPSCTASTTGDRSRKETLVEHGFRLPSAARTTGLCGSRSSTSGSTSASFCPRPRRPTRSSKSNQVVEQIVRPTGLVDPEVIVKPTKGQIDDLMAEIARRPSGATASSSRPSPRRWPRTSRSTSWRWA